MTKRVFAIAAHPDDIEFLMAGTLILLRRAGWEAHCLCIANGSCGTADLERDEIVRIRREEARAAAESIGAVYHESLVDDLQIFYEIHTFCECENEPVIDGTIKRKAPVLIDLLNRTHIVIPANLEQNGIF